jgi:hypothetical protein
MRQVNMSAPDSTFRMRRVEFHLLWLILVT